MSGKTLDRRVAALEAQMPPSERREPPDAETLEAAREMLPDGSAGEVHALAERIMHPANLSDAELAAVCDILAAKYAMTGKELERLAVAEA